MPAPHLSEIAATDPSRQSSLALRKHWDLVLSRSPLALGIGLGCRSGVGGTASDPGYCRPGPGTHPTFG